MLVQCGTNLILQLVAVVMDHVLPITFIYLGHGMTGRAVGLHSVEQRRRFHALFGISPAMCCLVWTKLADQLQKGTQPMHLLWGLLFLKTYATEEVMCTITQTDRKTFRKWSWSVVTEISNLDVVSFMVAKWFEQLTLMRYIDLLG